MPTSSSDSQASGAVPREKFVTVGDLELHYLSRGEGPAVVFLHGSGPGASGYSNFKQNLDAVNRAGFRAIVFDMIGFGYSSKPTDRDYTTEMLAGTVRAALAKIGIEKCVLVGNSLGGAVSIRIALDDPALVAGLVLMAPGGIESGEVYYAMPGIKHMIATFTGGELDFEGMRQLLQMLVKDPALVDDALVSERYEVLQLQPTEVLSRLKVANMEGELGKLRCPIIGFWGSEDQFCPTSGYRKFIDNCADCAFTIVADCGHWVMTERPAMFDAQMTAFLERMKPGFALDTSASVPAADQGEAR
jgi:4,5:9,10-diseco-3-hydroxy-5,9,17-trioxoandrosta-1(10),2-diene-4-oate hydrolase